MSNTALKLLLLLGAGYCIAAAYGASQRAPRLEVSPVFDLGELEHDRELNTTVAFRNSGNGILRLEPPITGCSCARAELSANEFGPGEKGSFRFVLRPVAPPGADYTQEIQIPSNDPLEPRRVIQMRGRMRNRLMATPLALNGYNAHPGAEWTEEIVIYSTDETAEFQVISLDCDLPDVRIEGPLPYGDPDEHSWLVLVSHIPQTIGRIAGRLKVQTSHREYRELDIPIVEDVTSRLTASPASVLLGGTDDRLQQAVTITASQPFRLSLAVPSESMWDADLKEESESRWSVTVGLRSHADVPEIDRGELRLNVEGIEHESQIVIPVVVLPGPVQTVASGQGDA